MGENRTADYNKKRVIVKFTRLCISLKAARSVLGQQIDHVPSEPAEESPPLRHVEHRERRQERAVRAI